MKSPLNLIEPLKGLAFPEVCQVCGDSWAGATDGFACRKCRSNIFKSTPPWCEQCGLPFEQKKNGEQNVIKQPHVPRRFATKRARGRGLGRAKRVPAVPLKVEQRHDDEDRNQNRRAPGHVAEEAGHLHSVFFRNGFHHEVGRIADVGVGPHKHRATTDG